MKTCAKCKETKPSESFGIRRRRGRTELLARCTRCTKLDRDKPAAKEAMKVYSQKAYEANRDIVNKRSKIVGDVKMAKIEEIKAKPCMDCGKCFPPECMDFDHLDDTQKSFNLSRARWKTWEDIEKEIAKTELVCSNCHRTRTLNRGQFATNGAKGHKKRAGKTRL